MIYRQKTNVYTFYAFIIFSLVGNDHTIYRSASIYAVLCEVVSVSIVKKSSVCRDEIFFSAFRWSIKPLYGLLSDFLPLCGYHRYSYLLITTMINLVAWISLYLVKISYASLLSLCVLAAFSLAFNDVLSKKKENVSIICLMKNELCFCSISRRADDFGGKKFRRDRNLSGNSTNSNETCSNDFTNSGGFIGVEFSSFVEFELRKCFEHSARFRFDENDFSRCRDLSDSSFLRHNVLGRRTSKKIEPKQFLSNLVESSGNFSHENFLVRDNFYFSFLFVAAS